VANETINETKYVLDIGQMAFLGGGGGYAREYQPPGSRRIKD
jgi:hypothetical protein